ncbi:MAG: GNAT family N-acetyltransferase [Rhodospirillales bacterium]|nr:GNAT family N-acetyltransferase [Rhodospirillales bacterium]
MAKGEHFHRVEITVAHVDVLARLHGEAFVESWDAEAFVSALHQPGALGFIVARDTDDEPLGFVLLRVSVFDSESGGEAEVLTLATRPFARRLGVARGLMDAALAALAEQGVTRVFLEVAADNVAAAALYTSLGFVEIGRRKAYYARGSQPRMDAIVMGRDVGL